MHAVESVNWILVSQGAVQIHTEHKKTHMVESGGPDIIEVAEQGEQTSSVFVVPHLYGDTQLIWIKI